jgi:AraC-like DNA-binding protein
MIFQHVAGDGFDIWFSNYLINRSVRFTGGSNQSVLEFHAHYHNGFETTWEGLGNWEMRHRQFQISYVPYVETTGIFPQGQHCHTFDIHFRKEILQPYAAFCPPLAVLLENVEKGKPASLLNVVRFLSAEMEEAIKDILGYVMHDGLQAQYFNGKVHELLVNMVYHIGLLESMPKLEVAELRHAEQAMKIILSDFSVYDSVEKLARKVGTSEQRLQVAFKQMYGTTVGKFSKEARMKHAYNILSDNNNEKLLIVALAVGYPDAANFATAFKNYFGYPPGAIKKRKRFR